MLIPSFVDSPAIFKSLGLTLSGPIALSGFIVVSCFPRNVVSTLMFCKVGVTEVICSFVSSDEPVKNGCEVIYEMFHILNCGF